MTTKVLIPKGGMGTAEATLIRWIKQAGDPVTEGEIIAEVETAKAVVEVPAPVSGVLTQILLAEGQTADVHSEMAVIDESR